MRPSCRPLRDPSLRIAGLTALSAGLLACSATTRPGDALDGAAGIDSQDSGGAADVRPAPDGGSSAADATAPGHATPSSATDATASSDGSEDTTVPPADAADATTVADAAEAGLQQLSDAGPASAMATAYLNNPAHTSAALDPSLAPPLAAIWSFATPSVELSISYPLIAGGRVYFVYGSTATNAAAQLTAVDEHTGAPIWGPVDLVADGIAGQAYDGEQVFTVDSTGVVRSFDAATGAPGWTTTLSSSPGPPTAYKGLLYVANAGTLTALDEATGQVTWTATLGYGIGATSPAVTDDGVFVSAACGDLSAFDRTAGSVLWHHLSTCGAFAGQPMVFDGRVYLEESEPEAQVDIFDVGSGGLLASLPCFIPPAFDQGQAYCNQRTPLEAFDLTTGAAAWTFSGDGRLNLGPFVAAGTVYVASDTGMMFGVDEATGAEVWSTGVGSPGAAPVGGEGILLTQLYANAGVVAYAHFEAPDASVVLGDGAPPAPFTLVAGVNPLALALDDTNVYWADFQAGQVAAAPKSGGSPVTTLWNSTTMPPRAIAIDATNVYVLASGDLQNNPTTTIAAVPKGGGTPLSLASPGSLLAGPLAAGPSLVYWVDGNVQSVPETGGTVTTVPPGFIATALAVDGSNLYWSALDGIHSEPFSGGPPQLVGVPPNPESAIAQSAASSIAVDGTNVYYLGAAGSIGFVPIAGGAATVLASGRPGSLAAIAIDDQNVYWVEGQGTGQGAIAAAPKTGGQVSVLVSGLSDPMALAVDSTGVYFPNDAGIGKIAK